MDERQSLEETCFEKGSKREHTKPTKPLRPQRSPRLKIRVNLCNLLLISLSSLCPLWLFNCCRFACTLSCLTRGIGRTRFNLFFSSFIKFFSTCWHKNFLSVFLTKKSVSKVLRVLVPSWLKKKSAFAQRSTTSYSLFTNNYSLFYRRLRCSQSRDRHPERRTRYIIHTQPMTEIDTARFSAVLTANTNLKITIYTSAKLNAHFN